MGLEKAKGEATVDSTQMGRPEPTQAPVKDGINVGYNEGHQAPTTQPVVGARENIYVSPLAQAGTQPALDSVLLPKQDGRVQTILAFVDMSAGPFNCVIVLEDTEVSQGAATTQPATQPATPPTTQPGN